MPAAVLLAGAAAFAAHTTYAADDDTVHVVPGNWETVTTTEVPGMPPRPPMTLTHCVKPDDIKSPRAFIEKRMQQNTKCTFPELHLANDHLTYSITCENGASGSGEVTFGGTSYESSGKFTMPPQGNRPAMTITTHTKGRRTGDC